MFPSFVACFDKGSLPDRAHVCRMAEAVWSLFFWVLRAFVSQTSSIGASHQCKRVFIFEGLTHCGRSACCDVVAATWCRDRDRPETPSLRAGGSSGLCQKGLSLLCVVSTAGKMHVSDLREGSTIQCAMECLLCASGATAIRLEGTEMILVRISLRGWYHSIVLRGMDERIASLYMNVVVPVYMRVFRHLP